MFADVPAINPPDLVRWLVLVEVYDVGLFGGYFFHSISFIDDTQSDDAMLVAEWVVLRDAIIP